MVDVILGMQWGDEGKGKIVDYFAKNYDVVYVRPTKISIHTFQSRFHTPLKYCSCVFESKWHYVELKMSILAYETSFLFTRLIHCDLPVSAFQVKARKIFRIT